MHSKILMISLILFTKLNVSCSNNEIKIQKINITEFGKNPFVDVNNYYTLWLDNDKQLYEKFKSYTVRPGKRNINNSEQNIFTIENDGVTAIYSPINTKLFRIFLTITNNNKEIKYGIKIGDNILNIMNKNNLNFTKFENSNFKSYYLMENEIQIYFLINKNNEIDKINIYIGD